MKTILLFLTLLHSSILLCQKNTQNLTIDSKILSEKRELVISLPHDYSNQKKYPVSYVLDGETLFEGHKDVINYLSGKNVIPQIIIVGIKNNNRSLDLTHVADSSSNFKPNGGGQKFEDFIIEELIPLIDSSYSTAPYRILCGHSISGLFATKLLYTTNEFNAFLIMDPALWWAEMEAISNTETFLKNPILKEKKIFLSIANSLPTSIQSLEHALKDTTNATLGIRSAFEFEELLSKNTSEKIIWKSQYYEVESHGTVPFISSYDGLKFIFDFYKKPSFQTLTDSSHIVLDEHYKMLSKKLGYTIIPSAYDLSGLAWRCQELENNSDRSYSFLELYINYYPTDPMSYMQMGKYFDLKGKKKKAQEYYQKGVEHGFDPNGN
ncbi:alpha/beta hydrolase [Crocinitomix catalasitica]|uniref:alpha/beta hydrolase n=1 Tax=Crocinitomix catalasitica TaxID=184607 RepID=UPI0004830D46|nr:alpha/beta hydrolase-fold protein [Crocinitomix catalasitica]